jgi:lipopolysaccharide/colanic/teichoic acid biosynthesis glycosyltransferase
VALQDDGPIGRANPSAALRSVLPAFHLDHVAKRLADIAAATLGLVLFSPLVLIACIAIRLDSRGPILVGESRYGYRNRPIQVLKFRLFERCRENDRSRPQLTRVGRVLSQTGIDELPRLLNVLWGQLSIIGPSPSAHPKMSLNRAKPGMIQWARIIATWGLD